MRKKGREKIRVLLVLKLGCCCCSNINQFWEFWIFSPVVDVVVVTVGFCAGLPGRRQTHYKPPIRVVAVVVAVVVVG